MSRLVINMRDPRPVWSIPDWAVEEIIRSAPQHLQPVVLGSFADGRGDGGAPSPEAAEALRGAEVYLGFGFPRDLYQAARGGGDTLRWVHSAAAGVGGALYPEMLRSPILLTNSAGIHAEPIADTVIAAIHYFARGLDFAVHAMSEHRWARGHFDRLGTPVREIAGSTIGIVGYGGIGRAVARRARALEMEVLALRRRALAAEEGVQVLSGPEGLAELLRRSQYVVLALPRTAETEYLLDEEHLAVLRPDAVLLNVGRGELLDEDALARLLAAGAIRGAALDVFVREPLPADSPFWSLPNVLITPHVSATTDRFWRREVDLIRENLGRYGRGEALVNLVDKHAGY